MANTLAVTNALNATNAAHNAQRTNNNHTNVTADGYAKSNTESAASKALGKDSFLQLLVAQMTNLDPTQDQDSTQYITQLAQFSSMEQLYNLNQTMTTFAYQSLIGKGATMKESEKVQYTGVIRGVSVDGSGNYSLALEVNNNGTSEIKVFSADKLVSVLDSSDNTNNNEMLLNSAFSTASSLASGNKKVLLSDTDSDGHAIYVKGIVKGAYIENGDVKMRVQTLNSDGSEGEIKIYSYSSIYKAGDLTDEDMNETPPQTETTPSTSAEAATPSTSTTTEATADVNAGNVAGNVAASENETGNSEPRINERQIERENSTLNSILGV